MVIIKYFQMYREKSNTGILLADDNIYNILENTRIFLRAYDA